MNESEKQKNGPHELNIDIEKDDWHVNKQLISTVGIGLIVNQPNGTRGEESKRQLKELLNIIKELSIHADFITPLIVGIDDDKGNKDDKNDKDDKDIFRNYQRDQNWHRGNFLICPNFNQEDLKKILHPEKPDLKGYEPKIIEIEDIIKELKNNEEIDIDLKKIIINSLDKNNIHSIFKYRETVKYWENKLNKWRGKEPKHNIDTDSYTDTDNNEDNYTNDSNSNLIDKIKSLEIKNFKGIEKLDVDLDADIILITGPNGNGKSSFIEALTLVLTGYHPELNDDKYDQEKNIYTDIPNHFLFYDSKEFTITVKDYNTNEYKVRGLSKDKTITIPNNLYINREQKKKQTDDRKLRFRLTSFLPDHIKLLFDEEIENGNTDTSEDTDKSDNNVYVLRQIFTDTPDIIDDINKAIDNILKHDIKDDIKTKENTIKNIDDLINYSEKLENFINKLKPVLHQLGLDDRIEWNIKDITNYKSFKTNIQKLEKQIEEIFGKNFQFSYEYLKKFCDELSNKIVGTAINMEEVENLENESSKLKERKLQIKEELKDLETDTYHTDAINKLTDVFNILADQDHINNCKNQLKKLNLIDIYKELEILDYNKINRFRKILTDIKDNKEQYRNKLLKELDGIKHRIYEIDLKLKDIAYKELAYMRSLKEFIKDSESSWKQIQSTLDILKTKDKEDYQKELDKLYKQKDELKKLKKLLDKICNPPEEFRKIFEDTINTILKRFAMTIGLDEVEITENFKIKAKEAGVKDLEDKDKRDLNCFSLGQRAQIALAWMITSRELVQNCESIEFPHRALILDDPTSSFDMTNLLSNALLCRQLAYHPDPKQRYQIFIVSHNEEFTDKLLDLLCPPGKDLKMKLIRFDDWTPDDGAKSKEFEVEPAPKDMEKARKAFEKGLKYFKELL